MIDPELQNRAKRLQKAIDEVNAMISLYATDGHRVDIDVIQHHTMERRDATPVIDVQVFQKIA